MVSLYRASVPMMIKYLHNLHAILTKAEEHCVAKGMKPEDMIQARLIEDMRGLDFQVQYCSNIAKFLASRVAGQEHVSMEDDEKTFEELHARIDKTIEILNAIPADSMDGKEDAELFAEVARVGKFKFTGSSYVLDYAIPNFHFHLSTGYAILRHLGVPLGAMDYIDSQRDLFVKVE